MFFDYSHAYQDMSQSLELCKKEKLDKLYAIVCANLGTLLNDYSRQYESSVIKKEARQMFLDSFNGAIKVKHWELLATTFVNMAEFDHNIEINKFKKLFSTEIPDSTPNVRYARFLYKAIESLQQHDYKKAITYFNNQLGVIDWHNTPERTSIVSHINLADAYKAYGNKLMAKQNLQIAEAQAKQYNAKDLEIEICKKMSDMYSTLGIPDSSRIYHIAYLEKRDSINKASQLLSVGEQNFIMEMQKEEEILEELTYKHNRQKIILILSGIIILVILIFTFIIKRKNNQLTANNKILYERMQELMRNEERHQAQIKSYEQRIEDKTANKASKEKYSKSNLDTETKDNLLRRIDTVMSDTEIICKQGFSVSQLAQLVNSNTTYVSQVINEKYGHSFNMLLGNNRIIEACRRIRDEQQYDKLTIEAISQSVGFKSRVTFVSAFKRVVGLTPSEYIKMAAQQEE